MPRVGRTWTSLVLGCSLYSAMAFAQRCGVERWSVKTGTDADAGGINLTSPKTANIADLITLQPPNPLPTDSRFAPTEATEFVVDATLTDFKLESGTTGDSDYHLVLMDDEGNTMVAEIPSPDCVGSASPFAAQIASARAKFDAQFTATRSFQTANVPVRVIGIGFFDFFHNQHGAASNVIELHPVLDIQFNPTLTSGDFAVSSSSPAMHLHGQSSSSISLTATPVNAGNLTSPAFTVSGLPAGVSALVTPDGNGKSKLLLSATANVPNGTFPITVTGSANGRSHSQTIALNLSNVPETTDVVQWEYKMISAVSEQQVVDQANQLGALDWEMVSVARVSGSPGWRAFFKRAKKD